jgi:hypothetical protein
MRLCLFMRGNESHLEGKGLLLDIAVEPVDPGCPQPGSIHFDSSHLGGKGGLLVIVG